MPPIPPLPELKQRPYEHRRPQRPSRLPKRTTPPPERSEPPDLTLMIYAGIVLAGIVLILAVPYAIQYLVTVMSTH
jgi:hypothetical protein